MRWAEYSALYRYILNNLVDEVGVYRECLFSILDGLADWWVWDEDFTHFVVGRSEQYVRSCVPQVTIPTQWKRTHKAKGVKQHGKAQLEP